MSDKKNNLFGKLTQQSGDLIDTMRKAETKDELSSCRVAFTNLIVNFEKEFANKMTELENEQEAELQKLRAIQKILNQ
tara:strand:+ start:1152 stop:1385 length:234 start_codon:yes stop_codon:yes gene_type:complete